MRAVMDFDGFNYAETSAPEYDLALSLLRGRQRLEVRAVVGEVVGISHADTSTPFRAWRTRVLAIAYLAPLFLKNYYYYKLGIRGIRHPLKAGMREVCAKHPRRHPRSADTSSARTPLRIPCGRLADASFAFPNLRASVRFDLLESGHSQDLSNPHFVRL